MDENDYYFNDFDVFVLVFGSFNHYKRLEHKLFMWIFNNKNSMCSTVQAQATNVRFVVIERET